VSSCAGVLRQTGMHAVHACSRRAASHARARMFCGALAFLQRGYWSTKSKKRFLGSALLQAKYGNELMWCLLLYESVLYRQTCCKEAHVCEAHAEGADWKQTVAQQHLIEHWWDWRSGALLRSSSFTVVFHMGKHWLHVAKKSWLSVCGWAYGHAGWRVATIIWDLVLPPLLPLMVIEPRQIC